MIKLLYIHQYFKFPSDSGGTRSYDLATSFAKEGIDVTVITSNSGLKNYKNQQKKWELIEKDNITVWSLRCPYDNTMSFYKRISSFLSFMYHASLKVLQLDADIVLATSTPLTIGIPALLRRKIKKTPYVFEVRDVWPEVPIKMGFIKNSLISKGLYFFEKKIYDNASSIVPLSVGMEKSIKTRYKDKEYKLMTIPNISEIHRFSTYAEVNDIKFDESKKTLVYAGTLGYVNGIKYIVDLMFLVQKHTSDVYFYIIGSGKEKEDIISYALKKGVLNKSVFFFNPISKENLSYIYNKAYMGSSFVIDIPVLWDNSANKFFDTLAAGKPMLINHRGWQAEVIESFNCGYVLPPQITEESTKAFVKYLNNKPLLLQQGENSLSVAKQNYSLEIAVEKYLKIFKDII